MLITTPISPAAAEYYFRGQAEGRWVGAGAAHLGLSGSVDRRVLATLLRGCHPGDGHFLPARKPARRRAGWDLTLAAPKSVSVLAGVAVPETEAIAGAHVAAVDEVVQHFERRLLGLRRATAPGGLVPAGGLVAAAFDHRSNAAAQPHLHTHVLVCNLGRDQAGVWSAIDSRWWTERNSLSAIYQMSLRHHLGQCGLNFEWRVRDDGFAEVVGVPRAALRAASGRGRAAAANESMFGAKAPGRIVGIRSTATARTRRASADRPGPGSPQVPDFGCAEAVRLVQEARGVGRARMAIPGQARDLNQAATVKLAAARSSFRMADVLVALAACTPEGMSAAAAERWVGQFCASAHPMPSTPGQARRWTTSLARAGDERLWAVARHLASLPPPRAERQLLTATAQSEPGLEPRATLAARELVAGSRSLQILQAPPGRTNLLAQAAVLESAASVWMARGQRVAVVTSSEQAAQRWTVLTAIGSSSRPPQAGEVVVIDRSDRRPTPELVALLREVDRAGAQAVLLEGGTAPRLSWRCSAGLTRLGDELGRLEPGPPPDWAANPPVQSPGTARTTTAQAVRHLLTSWVEARTDKDPALLVGLGYAETDALNQAARALLVEREQIGGPVLRSGGRSYQAGEQALALRRLAPALPPGTLLSVAEVDPRRRAAIVTWAGHTAVLDRADLAHVGYGYAVTPPLAARAPNPLMVLGPADAMGAHRARVIAATRDLSDMARARDRGISLGMG